MSFWPQQLNFAVWCATTGCGVSRDITVPHRQSKPYTADSFVYLFHVYFTVRCILYEMGGIESVGALPDDPTFNQKDNHYSIVAYKKNLVVSSMWLQAVIFASHMGKTTGSVVLGCTPTETLHTRSGRIRRRICQTLQAKGLRMRVEQMAQETNRPHKERSRSGFSV